MKISVNIFVFKNKAQKTLRTGKTFELNKFEIETLFALFSAEYCKRSLVLFVTNILIHCSSKQMAKKIVLCQLSQESWPICQPVKVFFFLIFFLFIEISIIGTGVKYANILATKQALFKTNITLKNINK